LISNADFGEKKNGWPCFAASRSVSLRRRIRRYHACLAVPAASVATATVKPATTAVKSAATMEAATAVKVSSTVEATAVEIAAAIAVIKSTSVPAASVVPPAAAIIPTAAVTVSAAVVAMSVIAVVPGAGADEDAAYEPIRAVVAGGRASVRSIIVITIGADGSWAVIGRRSKSNAESDVLGARVRSREERDTESSAD
jgi:hypothetical protein